MGEWVRWVGWWWFAESALFKSTYSCAVRTWMYKGMICLCRYTHAYLPVTSYVVPRGAHRSDGIDATRPGGPHPRCDVETKDKGCQGGVLVSGLGACSGACADESGRASEVFPPFIMMTGNTHSFKLGVFVLWSFAPRHHARAPSELTDACRRIAGAAEAQRILAA